MGYVIPPSKLLPLWFAGFCIWIASSLSFMALMSIGSALFILPTIFALIGRVSLQESKHVLHNTFFVATLFLFFVAIASILAGQIWPPLGMHTDSLQNLKKLKYFVFPFAVAYLFTARDEVPDFSHKVWRVLAVAALCISLVAFVQFFAGAVLGTEFIQDKRFFRPIAATPYSHAQGLMFFHLSFASVMGFVFIFFFARVLWHKENRLAWLAISVAVLLAWFFTYSRISMAAIAVSIFLLLALRRPRLGALGLLLIIAASAVLWTQSPSLRKRVLDRGGWRDREVVWAAAQEMFSDRPLLGVGFNQTGFFSAKYARKYYDRPENALAKKVNEVHYYPRKNWFASHSHNNVLDALAATGILGLLAYLFWWGTLTYYSFYLYARSRYQAFGAASLTAIVAFQINGLTQLNFYDGKSQHMLMIWAGILLSLYLFASREEELAR